MMDPTTSVTSWRKIPARMRAGLEALRLLTVGDLLRHWPARHEDRRGGGGFPDGPTSTPVCLRARVADMKVRRFGRGRSLFEAELEEPGQEGMGGRITARWFNLPWMAKNLSVDDELHLFAKVKAAGRRLVIDHPEFESAEEGVGGIHTGAWVPVYPLAAGLKQRWLRELIKAALDEVDPDRVTSILPAGVAAQAPGWEGAGRFHDLVRAMHFPLDPGVIEAAGTAIGFEDLFLLQLGVALRARVARMAGEAPPCGKGAWLRDLVEGLPFALTAAQTRAIREIRADLKRDCPMRRLLQGDVGSGKTVVAMAAASLVAEGGAQVAVMAPTQLLAEQHFRTFARAFHALGLRVALRTGGREDDTHTELEASAAGAHRPHVVVGTHALLFDGADHMLDDVGLVIVDEQHKFGVAQRARLQGRGRRPHVLVMTATPIPRTLTMTVYGDLDVSVIDELPADRGAVVTGVRVKPKRCEVDAFLRGELEAGRQAYLVYPLVEESGKLDARAATDGWKEWRQRLSGFEVALLTGRTRPEEKEAVMRGFRDGRIHALVTTTVIEVGVDVPNATVMMVHDAGRFGLAQLHQLRGRIGRGGHKSWCILLLEKNDPEAEAKLAILEATRDGFRIAEEDLRLRGPGDILGAAQTGLPPLGAPARARLGDTRLLKLARDLAEQLLDGDPKLQAEEHAGLRHGLERSGGFGGVG